MRTILKQTSWLVFAQVFTKIVGFFYTIFLAKSLGVNDFGLYTVTLAYFSIISSFADFGFNRFLIREIARDKLKASELLCNIIMLRLTLISVIFGIFSVSLYLLDPDKLRVSLILLTVLAVLPQAVALTFDGIFVALQKLQFSAFALIVSSLTTALFGFYFVVLGFGTLGAVNALIIGQVVYVLILFILLYFYKGLFFSKVTLQILKQAFVGSLPYGLLGVLGLLYFRIDTVLLSYLKGNYQTGLYGAAYRFLEAIIFLPSSFAAALFPTLAKLHDDNLVEMKKLYYKSLRLMAVLGLFVLIFYITILPIFIKLFLPNYLEAINVIKILSLSIPFIFLSTPGVQVILSSDKYLKEVMFLSIFTLVFNIILNLLFIPQFGLLAAALITVLSDVLSFIIFYLFINKKVFKA